MKYQVNEIFTSVKGEGVFLGEPSSFIRLAGCNLRCDRCDTQFNFPVFPLSVSEILSRLPPQVRVVTLTGGEPTLQSLSPLISALHKDEKVVHIETNGTLDYVEGLDWICVSPKLDQPSPVREEWLRYANEVKFPIRGEEDLKKAEEVREEFGTEWPCVWFLHPWNDNWAQKKHGVSVPERAKGRESFRQEVVDLCMRYVIETGKWRVSLQAHKVWGVR